MTKRCTVIARLSDTCEYRCPHCYFADLLWSKREATALSAEVLSALLNQVQVHQIPEIHFEGDHPNIGSLLGCLSGSSLRVTLSASSELSDPVRLSEIARVVDQVNFSVDSWDSAVHDRLRRRRGSHAETVRQIHSCHRNGIRTFHWVALSVTNCEMIRRHVEFCSDLGSTGMAFLYQSPFGAARASECIEPSRWQSICATIEELREEFQHLRIHYEPVFLSKSGQLREDMACKCVVKDLVFVMPDGMAYPCPLLAGAALERYQLGNVMDKDVLGAPRGGLPRDRSFEGGSTHCPAERTHRFKGDDTPHLPDGVRKICYMYWNRGRSGAEMLR